MLCLWPPTFNQARRSLDGFTSTKAPIHAVVRAAARTPDNARSMVMMTAALLSSDKVEKVEEKVWLLLNRASRAGDPEVTRLVDHRQTMLTQDKRSLSTAPQAELAVAHAATTHNEQLYAVGQRQ